MSSTQPLPDLLAPNLKLVICGSAAGQKSADVGHYYAGPGNALWRTLFEIGLTPRELKPEEWQQLLEFGIGLTDLVKDQAGALRGQPASDRVPDAGPPADAGDQRDPAAQRQRVPAELTGGGFGGSHDG